MHLACCQTPESTQLPLLVRSAKWMLNELRFFCSRDQNAYCFPLSPYIYPLSSCDVVRFLFSFDYRPVSGDVEAEGAEKSRWHAPIWQVLRFALKSKNPLALRLLPLSSSLRHHSPNKWWLIVCPRHFTPRHYSVFARGHAHRFLAASMLKIDASAADERVIPCLFSSISPLSFAPTPPRQLPVRVIKNRLISSTFIDSLCGARHQLLQSCFSKTQPSRCKGLFSRPVDLIRESSSVCNYAPSHLSVIIWTDLSSSVIGSERTALPPSPRF